MFQVPFGLIMLLLIGVNLFMVYTNLPKIAYPNIAGAIIIVGIWIYGAIK